MCVCVLVLFYCKLLCFGFVIQCKSAIFIVLFKSIHRTTAFFVNISKNQYSTSDIEYFFFHSRRMFYLVMPTSDLFKIVSVDVRINITCS